MSRKNTTSGRSPLLQALLGSLSSSKGDLSGISFQNDPNDPYAEDFGDKPDKVAVADHWWNRGKAENVNNQLQLSGINATQAGKINNQSALDQQRMLMPGLLDEARQKGIINNEQHKALTEALGPIEANNAKLKAEATLPSEMALGNARKANDLGYMADPSVINMIKTTTTVPNNIKQLAGINYETELANANQGKLKRGEDIANTLQPLALSTAMTEAQQKDALSKLLLSGSPTDPYEEDSIPAGVMSTYNSQRAQEQAKLDLIKAQTKAFGSGAVTLSPSGQLVNKETGATVTTAPSEIENTFNFLDRRKAARDAASKTNNFPAAINVASPQSVNVPPATTNTPQAVPVNSLPATIVIQNGKPFKKLANGQLVPYTQ